MLCIKTDQVQDFIWLILKSFIKRGLFLQAFFLSVSAGIGAKMATPRCHCPSLLCANPPLLPFHRLTSPHPKLIPVVDFLQVEQRLACRAYEHPRII